MIVRIKKKSRFWNVGSMISGNWKMLKDDIFLLLYVSDRGNDKIVKRKTDLCLQQIY